MVEEACDEPFMQAGAIRIDSTNGERAWIGVGCWIVEDKDEDEVEWFGLFRTHTEFQRSFRGNVYVTDGGRDPSRQSLSTIARTVSWFGIGESPRRLQSEVGHAATKGGPWQWVLPAAKTYCEAPGRPPAEIRVTLAI